MSERVKLPDSTQLDTLNGKLESINTTLAGQEFVTKDNVVAALGGEPEMQLGEYELLNTINVTEDTQTFNYSVDDNGTPYNLKAVKIILSGYLGQLEVPTINVSTYNTSNTKLNTIMTKMPANTNSNPEYVSTAIGMSFPLQGYWSNIGAFGAQGGLMSVQFPSNGQGQFNRVTSTISRVYISLYKGTLIANSTVKIYGIRA